MANRITVVGNCQAPPLANALSLVTGLECTSIVAHVQVGKPEKPLIRHLETADIVLHFDIKAGFPVEALRSNAINARFGSRARTITNIYFEGVHPDCFYIGRMNDRLKGPLGEYHSRIILGSFLSGHDSRKAAANFVSRDLFSALDYPAFWDSSADNLLKRDEGVGLPFARNLIEQVRNEFSLFSFNHPSANVFLAYANSIASNLECLKHHIPPESAPNWLRNGPIFPIHSEYAELAGLNYSCNLIKAAQKEEYFSPIELADAYYRIYERKDRRGLLDSIDQGVLETISNV